MYLSIPKRLKSTKVNSLKEASDLYAKLRDESDEGASTFPWGHILDGAVTYDVSYNAKVWKSEGVIAYNPYAEA